MVYRPEPLPFSGNDLTSQEYARVRRGIESLADVQNRRVTIVTDPLIGEEADFSAADEFRAIGVRSVFDLAPTGDVPKPDSSSLTAVSYDEIGSNILRQVMPELGPDAVVPARLVVEAERPELTFTGHVLPVEYGDGRQGVQVESTVEIGDYRRDDVSAVRATAQQAGMDSVVDRALQEAAGYHGDEPRIEVTFSGHADSMLARSVAASLGNLARNASRPHPE